MAEELNRQKEKERLRKEYIDELKKRHEEEKNRLEQLHLKEQAGRREDQVARLTAEGMLHKVQQELQRIREFEQVPHHCTANRLLAFVKELQLSWRSRSVASQGIWAQLFQKGGGVVHPQQRSGLK